jgi:transcriptional regulator with XRE-family HTH domain
MKLRRKKAMGSPWGERIREIRQQSNLSQKDFAEKLGIATVTFNRMENGHRHPDIFLLEKIAKTFQVSLDWLILGKDENNPECSPAPLVPLLTMGELSSGNWKSKGEQKGLWLPDTPPCDFAMRIQDTAMAPLLRPGDIVLVAEKPGEVGDIIVVRDSTGIVRVRRQGCTAEEMLLVPENQEYSCLPAGDQDLVIGKVVGSLSWSRF